MSFASANVSERRLLPPSVAVSTVAFSLTPPDGASLGAETPAPEGRLWLPLVRRTRAPFLGAWALPGGPIRGGETLVDTSLRTLESAAGHTPDYIEQLYTFGAAERSALAERTVTIAYWALFGDRDWAAEGRDRFLAAERTAAARHRVAADEHAPASDRASDRSANAAPAQSRPRAWDDPQPPMSSSVGGRASADSTDRTDAESGNVAWFSADALPELAFDHAEIIAYALARLRTKTGYAAIAHRFLGPVFTLARLRAVTEAILGEPVDPANFRRQILADERIVDTGERETGGRHRPASLFRFREDPGTASPA
ncbi:NUDIX hydrolase, partial [Leucobacter sp. M11]|uniref:NUDIX hydrolase n=1 Tax=Leucobacter sp. M11 TaxID=2993565 RepID=UPI002D7F887D